MDITQRVLPATINSVVENQQTDLDERAMNTLLWKIDLRLLPLLTSLYFFSFLDRINIGHARRYGLEADLHLSPSEYYWAVLIFYISYTLSGVPSNLLMRRWSPSKWIGTLMLTWGIIIMLMALVYNPAGLLVARFFLGIAEGGFVPGVVFYLSLWYIRKDQAFRIGMFISGAVLGCAFDGILTYGIVPLGNEGRLAKWQWLFLVEGVPTVCLAIVTYKFLADPATVRWLDQCNKDILTTRLIADIQVIGNDNNESKSHQIRSIFLDWKVLFYLFIYLGAVMPIYGLNLFLPIIIKDMGYTDAIAELLIAPPYFVSYLAIIFCSWNAGRVNERSNHLMILFCIQIIGFLYLILAQKNLYFGTVLVGTGVFSSNALILSWVTNNTGDQTKRAVVIAMLIAFGTFGAITSGQIYRESDEDSYYQGHCIVIGILSFIFILMLLLKLLLKYKNRRRRYLITVRLQGETVTDERQTLLDKHPDFVYVI